MANDAIQIPIIKCQALCFWSCIICCFLLTSLFQEICTGNPDSKYERTEVSFSTYLKNMNAVTLAVDNCWFLSNNLVLLNSMLVTYTRNPKNPPTFIWNLYFVPKQVQLLLWKTVYLGYVSQIYYLSYRRTIFLCSCLFFLLFLIFFPKDLWFMLAKEKSLYLWC